MTSEPADPMADDSPDARPWYGWALRLLPALIPYTILVATGLWGVDYGYHWDEGRKQINIVRTMVETETLLPYEYIYPGVIYWIGVAGLVPETAALLVHKPPEGRVAHIAAVAGSVDYHLRMRSIMVCITALAVIWVYWTVYLWRRSWVQALLAACVLAFSWEFAYHQRNFTPNCLLAQFGALSLLLLTAAYLRQSERFVWAAAVCAGLAAGTKYPGGLLLLPVLLGSVLIHRRSLSWRGYFWNFVQIGVCFGVVMVVTTPGIIVQPTKVLHSVHYVMTVYAEGWYMYTVDGFDDHFIKLSTYLIGVALSPYWPLAIALFLLAALGVFATARQDWGMFLLLTVFPVTYFLYFCSQKAMIVRNVQVLLPFMAILAAGGVMQLAAWLAGNSPQATWRRWGRVAFIAALFCGLAANASWLVYAADSIAHRNGRGTHHERRPYEQTMARYDEPFLQQAADFLRAQPAGTVAVSPRVRQAMLRRGVVDDERILANPDHPRLVMAFHREALHRRKWPTHLPRLFLQLFGPYEVNLNYYPSWQGDDRVIVMRKEVADQVGVSSQLWANTVSNNSAGQTSPPRSKRNS